MLFIAALWFAGKLFGKFGMPALVGEIVFGIILGPHVLNLAGDHGSAFLVVIGEIGLVMLVVEAGVDVDIGMLKLVGPRGVGIAILGSVIPMAMGYSLSYLFMGTDIMTSIAIGACFAPTSMGIALKVLKGAKLLNTPTGQLIIASAILDDVIALIILFELQALADLTVVGILMPLIVSPVLILIIGYLAIGWIPKWIKMLMDRLPKEHRENGILALMFVATFAFVPMCHYLGASHLLGAFLAGLCFFTDHTIHHVWHHQIKRVLQWMLRIFFACTIGFAIPIKEFTSPAVLIRGFVYCIAGIGKIVQGFFAQPLNAKDFFIVGFSMSAWGEFAFILATVSYSEGTMDKESFSSVLLAVLLSVIYSPYGLAFVISYYEKQAQKKMDDHLSQFDDNNLHPLYFGINTKARGSWGHQDKILKAIFDLELEIIDFRLWHAPEYNTTHHLPLTKESFYVVDNRAVLPPTKYLSAEEKKVLAERVKHIREGLMEALGAKSVVHVRRWLPGVKKTDDKLAATDEYQKAMFGGEFKPVIAKSAEYCRKEAFKQANSIMAAMTREHTMKELKRVSSRILPGIELEEEFDDNGNPVKDKTEKLNAGMEAEASVTFTGAVEDHNRTRSAASGQQDLASGGGHTGATGAGGAGALPVSDGTINIANGNHFKDDDPSLMSYIYGDEDSQHHQLPDYSMSHMTPKLIPAMTPMMGSAMPRLAEEHDDDSSMGTDEDFDAPQAGADQFGMQMSQIMGASGHADVSGVKKAKSGGYTIKVHPPQTRPEMEKVASMSPAGSLDDSGGYMQ